MVTLEQVFELFEKEFAPLGDKFRTHVLELRKAMDANDAALNAPGVYLYWKGGLGVVKVGKHQVNARKRALEHLRDNTRNENFEMCSLRDDADCKLVLITVSNKGDVHWVPSLEYFLEARTNPIIPSGRNG